MSKTRLSCLSADTILFPKHEKINIAPISEVTHMVAQEDTPSGITENMTISLDQMRVTINKEIFACRPFMRG